MPGGTVIVPACFHVTPSAVVDTLTLAGLSTMTQSLFESIRTALLVAQPLIPRLSKRITHRLGSIRMFGFFRLLRLRLTPTEQRGEQPLDD